MIRTIEQTWREMREMGDAIAVTFRDRTKANHLVSNKQYIIKTWQPNTADVGMGETVQPQKPLTTVWHRDIVAAKLILYKGMH